MIPNQEKESSRQSGKTQVESLLWGERCGSEGVEVQRLWGRRLLLRSTVDDQFCEGHRPEVIHDSALSVQRARPGLTVGRADVAFSVAEALVLAVSAAVLRVEGFGSKRV